MSRGAAGLFIFVILVNLIFNGVFQLHYDEAYYWVWGQNLSLSYFDHPPMIAYMVRLASYLGNTEVYTRLPALLTTIVTCFTVYALAKRMFDQTVANISLLLAISCPLIQAMFFIVTPDSPLLMFWALTLYAFYRGVFEDKVSFLYLTGFFAGCAMLSKYTALLIFPSIFIFLITSKKYRAVLFKKDIYLSFILSFIVFSPVIIWNYQHEWVSFLFQFHHGMALGEINWHSFGDYWGGEALMAGPVMFVAMLYYGIRYIKTNTTDPKIAFVFWSFAFGLLFFAYSGLFKHVEANWPGMIYVSGAIFLAKWLVTFNNKWVYRFCVGFILFILLICKFPLTFAPQRFHNKIPGVNVFYGNKELLEKVKPYMTPDTVVLACDYGNASRAWYYLHLKRTYVLDKFRFAHAYSYWGKEPTLPIKSAIYICDGDDDLIAPAILHEYFSSVKLLDFSVFSNVITENKIYIYRVNN